MQDASFHLAADDAGQDFRAEGALSTSAPSAGIHRWECKHAEGSAPWFERADDGAWCLFSDVHEAASLPATGLVLAASEQRYLLSNPESIALLMDYHSLQQDQADSMGAECFGNQRRYDELRALGKSIVLEDPEIWSPDIQLLFLGRVL